MTVAALTPSVSYTENGVTLNFAVPFRYLDPTHLVVTRTTAAGMTTTLAYGANYTATAGPTDAGGTLTLGASVAGSTLKITRLTPRSQAVDYVTGDRFPADTHELALDRLTMIGQEQDVGVNGLTARALLFPVGDAGIGVLPTVAQRLGCTLAFDAVTGLPVVGPDIASVGTVAASVAAIGTVAGSIANVNTVAGSIANVNLVGGSIASVNTAAANIAAITAAPGYASTASTAATNAGNYATAAAASAASATNAPGTKATSTDSLTIGTGSKGPFALVEAGKQFALGQWVTIANTATPTNFMTGQITGFDGTNMTVTVPAGATGGAGTFTAWTISLAAQPGTASALPTSGGAMTGLLTTAASAAGGAGLNVPHGTAPSAPVNGDFWSTTAGFYGRVNSATVGPFGSGGSPITSSSAQAFAVGQNGNTNPAFNVDASTASSATGVTVKSAAAGGGVTITATSSAANESLTIKSKGFGNVFLQSPDAINGSTGGYSFRAMGYSGQSFPPAFKIESGSLGATSTITGGGGMEHDGGQFYAHVDSDMKRGLIEVQHNVYQNNAYALTAQTAAQRAFNGGTLNPLANGALQVGAGTYEFEALIMLSGMSSTSGSFGFAFGGTATVAWQAWECVANKNAGAGAVGSPQSSYNTAANTAVATANTNTSGYMRIKGQIQLSAAGTLIPQVSLGVAAAAQVGIGSFFKLNKISNSLMGYYTGNWS